MVVTCVNTGLAPLTSIHSIAHSYISRYSQNLSIDQSACRILYVRFLIVITICI